MRRIDDWVVEGLVVEIQFVGFECVVSCCLFAMIFEFPVFSASAAFFWPGKVPWV